MAEVRIRLGATAQGCDHSLILSRLGQITHSLGVLRNERAADSGAQQASLPHAALQLKAEMNAHTPQRTAGVVFIGLEIFLSLVLNV